MHLARMETRVAVNTLFDRLPDMRLDPEPGQDLHIKGMAFRSPIALPIAFTAGVSDRPRWYIDGSAAVAGPLVG